MSIELKRAPNHLYILILSGRVNPPEFRDSQKALAHEIEAGVEPRVLALLQDFRGFESDAGWDDLNFQIAHGPQIAKIAIVGDPVWEAEVLVFAGAGFRRAPVRFFPANHEAAARVWLASAEVST